MTVESIRLRLLLIGPVRLVLGVVFLGAARAAGGSSTGTLVAFAASAFALAFFLPNDPRTRFRRADREPEDLPADATVAPAWLHVVHAALPSTVGVSILAAVTLAFNPTLAALLAGSSPASASLRCTRPTASTTGSTSSRAGTSSFAGDRGGQPPT